MTQNSMMRIVPHKVKGIWLFDDPKRGLKDEAFVSGSSEIIDALTAHIPNAEDGVSILFSAEFFPTHQVKLEWVKKEGNGNWYECNGMLGWLCPALFLYFDEAPQNIYLQVI